MALILPGQDFYNSGLASVVMFRPGPLFMRRCRHRLNVSTAGLARSCFKTSGREGGTADIAVDHNRQLISTSRPVCQRQTPSRTLFRVVGGYLILFRGLCIPLYFLAFPSAWFGLGYIFSSTERALPLFGSSVVLIGYSCTGVYGWDQTKAERGIAVDCGGRQIRGGGSEERKYLRANLHFAVR